jgi:CheY-like chemotaxis protein
MLRRSIVLASVLLLTGLPSARAETLAAGNDGPVTQHIVAFVDAVTTPGRDFVPLAERIAVFANDKTKEPGGTSSPSSDVRPVDAAGCRYQNLVVSPAHRHVVLVVEDYEDHRKALLSYLEGHGIEAYGAASGADALARLADGLRPCGMVVDVAIGDMDGWTLVERVRADPALAGIGVVMYSGHPVDAERAARVGVRRYLVKPLDPARIVAALEEHCRDGQDTRSH